MFSTCAASEGAADARGADSPRENDRNRHGQGDSHRQGSACTAAVCVRDLHPLRSVDALDHGVNEGEHIRPQVQGSRRKAIRPARASSLASGRQLGCHQSFEA